MPQHPEQGHHTKRDAETLFMLGLFLSVLGVTVLIETAWIDRPHAIAANVVSGLALLGLGSGWIIRGWWVKKHLD